jgi:multidrug transporter EmrE-like cation transporter
MAVVVWLMGIGTVWGATNALMKRGALIAAEEKKKKKKKNQQQKASSSSISKKSTPATLVWSLLQEWVQRLCVWEYSLPFLLNLSMSVLFVIKLGDSPITLAVPVTNATTFAVTAIAGAVLGEKMKGPETLIGVSLIIAGVTLCISPPLFSSGSISF